MHAASQRSPAGTGSHTLHDKSSRAIVAAATCRAGDRHHGDAASTSHFHDLVVYSDVAVVGQVLTGCAVLVLAALIHLTSCSEGDSSRSSLAPGNLDRVVSSDLLHQNHLVLCMEIDQEVTGRLEEVTVKSLASKILTKF